MDYVRIGTVKDLGSTKIKSYKIFGRIIAVLKKADGSYEAIEAACKHQGADLTTGERKGWTVTCPRHGWKYDLETGHCLNHDSLPLKKYNLKIDGEDIHVSLQPIEE
ncbi:Rieske (2Fe-2S) protein [Desulfopila sp. IMCC35008]|uniref:Rieske (2Fe-2S) protein n=1 Tax=Desulfopila sp. IMCC35008 TaxID=2653858 RepID=UPI0013D64398|nr:Rieske (2Fe-2S) protein [Desulfopila sp. IMCC35008]